LESSNVNVVQEVMRMLEALRNYQSCMKVIESNDELNAKAVNELARI
jgi:flagellar basal-body rod protein FlgF